MHARAAGIDRVWTPADVGPTVEGMLRSLDRRAREYFGGPGIGTMIVLGLALAAVQIAGRAAGLDVLGVALVMAAVGVVIVVVGRMRRRTSSR